MAEAPGWWRKLKLGDRQCQGKEERFKPGIKSQEKRECLEKSTVVALLEIWLKFICAVQAFENIEMSKFTIFV